jgi:hypothetical protein
MNDKPCPRKRRPRGWTAIVDLADILDLNVGVTAWRWERGLPVSDSEELIGRLWLAANSPRSQWRGRVLQKVLRRVRELVALARTELESPADTNAGTES